MLREKAIFTSVGQKYPHQYPRHASVSTNSLKDATKRNSAANQMTPALNRKETFKVSWSVGISQFRVDVTMSDLQWDPPKAGSVFAYLGGIRIAPSSLMTSPFSIGLEIIASTIWANSAGRPSRLG